MTLTVITQKEDLLTHINQQKEQRKKIGFVPTMGALHAGHGSLIARSVAENDHTVVSIFVNPKQFGPTEDLDKYPRTLNADSQLCAQQGANIIFAPHVQGLYPEGFATTVSVAPNLSSILCGQFRPTHFTGVTTVVSLLLHLVQPTNLYLGQKDYQQVQIIKQMCRDLMFPTNIVTAPTFRETDGLAMSSRNQYLVPEARQKAAFIPKALAKIAYGYLNQELSVEKLKQEALLELKQAGLTPQYLEFRLAHDLTKTVDSHLTDDTAVLLAQPVELNGISTRLIDNIILSRQPHSIDSLHTLLQRTL